MTTEVIVMITVITMIIIMMIIHIQTILITIVNMIYTHATDNKHNDNNDDSNSRNNGDSNTVGVQNLNLLIFNLRVSNPNKLIVYVFLIRCRISMCQGLGPTKTR